MSCLPASYDRLLENEPKKTNIQSIKKGFSGFYYLWQNLLAKSQASILEIQVEGLNGVI